MLVRELLAEYKNISWMFFREQLRVPTLALVETTSRLGAWIRETRTLEISRPLVLAQPWGAVLEVLKHEMAHQYVSEVLRVVGESAHGPAFQRVCEEIGVDPAASGVPGSREENPFVAKVAKLLALAESPNRHEAEAAMAAAQKLMLKHNIEHATGNLYGFRQLGTPTKRTEAWQRILAMILGKHFFVEVVWVPVYRPLEGKRGSVLEICGSQENLAMAEHVFHFLIDSAQRLFDESGLSRRERRNFLSGVMSGFDEKLHRQGKKHVEEGLVWVGDADLEAYYEARHPKLRWVRYGGTYRTRAFESGKAKGREIVLHRPVRGEATSRGRLLTKGS
jgi:hypothetical protein